MSHPQPQAPRLHEFTVKEYARHERVSERTVWTWISKKAIPVRRTPGGSVRVQVIQIAGSPH